MWSPWKCEITTASMFLMSMPEAARFACPCPIVPLLVASAPGPKPVSMATSFEPVFTTTELNGSMKRSAGM